MNVTVIIAIAFFSAFVAIVWLYSWMSVQTSKHEADALAKLAEIVREKEKAENDRARQNDDQAH